ncbi:MAG: hypothetical protein RLW62_09500, partial [Gammaproteobacteria bacterium]
MSASRVALLEALRTGIDVHSEAVAGQVLYEDWLGRDAWCLDSAGLPLLVGVDPECWPAHVAAHDLAVPAAALLAQLTADLDVAATHAIAPVDLGTWARKHGCSLPAPFERVLDFILRVLPAPVGASHAAAAEVTAAAERELLLGAALMLVTRFPARCRDAHGFFDGARIADLILEKAALWFP